MILISAGHSNSDPGAVGNGYTEAQIVTEFRNLVAFYLKRAEVDFITDGEGEDNKPLRDAIELAKTADLAVEFHCNSFSNPAATGVETLSDFKHRKLGGQICQAISGVLGITNRGAKGESAGQHSRLGFVRAGGIIVELFFISNPDDVAVYQAKKWLVAHAVAELLMEHGK